MVTKKVNLSSKKLLMGYIKQLGMKALELASEELRQDPEIIKYAIEETKGKLDLKLVDTKNKDIMKSVLKKDGLLIKYVDESLREDEELAIIALKQNIAAICYLPEKIKDNKEIMIMAIKMNPAVIKYVSKRLQNDKDIAITAIKENALAIKYVSKEIQADEEIMLMVVKQNGLLLEYASENLKNDVRILKTAIKQNVDAIRYAPEIIRQDRNIMKEALRYNGLLLEIAPEEIKKDYEMIKIATKQNMKALKYASEDKKMVVLKEALRTHRVKLFDEIGKEFKGNEQFFLYCVELKINATRVIEYFDFSLFKEKVDSIGQNSEEQNVINPTTRQLIIELLLSSSLAFKYADDSIKDDKEIVMKVIEKYPICLQHASEKLRRDPEVVMIALKENQNGTVVNSIDTNLIGTNKNIMIQVLKLNGTYFKYANSELRNDKELVLIALKKSLRNISYIGEDLRNDPDFINTIINEFDPNKILKELNFCIIGDEEFKMKLIENAKKTIQNKNKEKEPINEELVYAIFDKIEPATLFSRSNETTQINGELITKELLRSIREFMYNNNTLFIYLLNRYPNDKSFFKYFNVKSLQQDSKIMYEMVKNNKIHNCFWKLTDEQKKDRNIIYEMLKRQPYYYKNISEELKEDKEIALTAMKKETKCLYNIPDKLKKDKEFIKILIKEIGPYALAFADQELKQDKEYIIELIDEFDYKIAKYIKNVLKYEREILEIIIPQIIEEQEKEKTKYESYSSQVTSSQITELLTPKKYIEMSNGKLYQTEERKVLIEEILKSYTEETPPQKILNVH